VPAARLKGKKGDDVLNGNPFRRFSDDDFSFYKNSLRIQKTNADCWPTDPNEIDVEARSSDFKIDILGFDPNRDLIVEAHISNGLHSTKAELHRTQTYHAGSDSH
jgi:hypothetical protein